MVVCPVIHLEFRSETFECYVGLETDARTGRYRTEKTMERKAAAVIRSKTGRRTRDFCYILQHNETALSLHEHRVIFLTEDFRSVENTGNSLI